MSRRLLASVLALVLVLALPASAYAQEYLFAVERETIDVYWNADGTSSLEYTFHFVNQAGAHAIDFVDVGMPVSTFDMSTVSADVDGTRVDVSQGEYRGSGAALVLMQLSSQQRRGLFADRRRNAFAASPSLYPR